MSTSMLPSLSLVAASVRSLRPGEVWTDPQGGDWLCMPFGDFKHSPYASTGDYDRGASFWWFHEIEFEASEGR